MPCLGFFFHPDNQEVYFEKVTYPFLSSEIKYEYVCVSLCSLQSTLHIFVFNHLGKVLVLIILILYRKETEVRDGQVAGPEILSVRAKTSPRSSSLMLFPQLPHCSSWQVDAQCSVFDLNFDKSVYAVSARPLLHHLSLASLQYPSAWSPVLSTVLLKCVLHSGSGHVALT